MAKKNNDHWKDIISSLEDDADQPSDEKADQSPEKSAKRTPAKKTGKKPAKSAKAEPSQSRDAKKASTGKRSAKAGKQAELEKSLLDSLEGNDPQIHLTVGEAPEEKKSRRAKKSEKGLVEKAVAAEEKKERAKRVRIAKVIAERAEEPFREIASQIKGRIDKLSKEEAEEEAEAPWEGTEGSDAQNGIVKEETESSKTADSKDFEEDFWGFSETLEVSWGRSPKREEPAADKQAPADKQEEEELSEIVGAETPKPEKKKGKISREEAEEKFASFFGEESASQKSAPAKAEPAAVPPTVEDNDFWGIPDEPEISFATRKKTAAVAAEPKPEPKQKTPQRENKPERAVPREVPLSAETSPAAQRKQPVRDDQQENRRPPRQNTPRDARMDERRKESHGDGQRGRRNDDSYRERNNGPREEDAYRPSRRQRGEQPRERDRREEPSREKKSAPREDRPCRGPRWEQTDSWHDEARYDDAQDRWTDNPDRIREAELYEKPRYGEPREDRYEEDPYTERRVHRTEPQENNEDLFPTWQDAIGGIVSKNITRHGGSPRGESGDRRRR